MLTYLPPLPLSTPHVPSKRLPRSPYLSPLSPSPSSSSTLASLSLHDVLVPGDIVGEGSYLKGHVLGLVANNHHSQYQQPAVEFQVIKELGKGSYAVVYLVQEIISKSQEDDNDHMSTIGLMDLDTDKSTCYGRKFAIKCLSKANLDQDALAIQMSEVTIHQSLPLHPNIVTLHRTLETPAYLLLLLEYVPGEDLFYFLEQSRDHDDLNHYYDDDSSPLASSHTPPTPSLLSTLHPSQLLSKTRLRLIASMFSQMCDAVATCHAHQVFHRDIKPENFIVTDGIWTAPDGSLERKVVVKLSDFGLSTKDIESSDMDCGSAPYMSYECRNNIAPTYGPQAADVWSLGIVLINMLYHSNPWTDTAEGACPSFWLFRQDPVSYFMNRFTGMTQPVADLLATRIFCVLDNPLDGSPRMSAAEFGVWVRNRLPTLLSGEQKRMSIGHRQSLTMPVSHRPTSRPPSVYSVVNRASSIVNGTVIGRSLSRAPSLKLEPALEREELSVVLDREEEAELDRDEDKGEQMLDSEAASRSTSTTKRRKRGLRKGKGAASSSSTPTPSVSSQPTSPTSLQDETCLNLAAASQSLVREISKASKTPSSKKSISSLGLDSTSRSGMEIRMFEPASVFALPSAILSIPYPPTVHATANMAPVTKKPSKWKLGFGKNHTTAAAANGHVSPQDDSPQPGSVDPSSHTPAHMSTTASNVTNLIMGLDPSLPVPSHANSSKDQHLNNNYITNGHSGGHVGGSHREGMDGMMIVPMGMGMGIGIGKGTWGRGRRGRMAGDDGDGSALNNHNSTTIPHLVPPSGSPLKHQGLNQGQSSGHTPSRPYQDPWSAFQDRRAVSPQSARSGYGHSHGHPGTGGGPSPPSPSSSSAISNSTNWRSSMSTVSSVSMSSGSSSCVSVVSGSDGVTGGNGRGGVGAGAGRAGFTRFNNSSVSTAATSVSSSSWRTSVKSVGGGAGGGRSKYGNIPKNVKPMDGIPWQLDQLPRGMHPNPDGDIFGSPPVRKPRTRKNKELGGGALGGSGGLGNEGGKLDTICERGVGVGGDGGKAQAQETLGNGVGALRDASTSTTDLAVMDVSGGAVGKEDVDASGGVGANGGGVKKVQKGQIHALAKMLSALRR